MYGSVAFARTRREASRILPRPFSPRLRWAGQHDQTHAYALTPAAAERPLRLQQPIALNVDTGIGRVILRGEVEASLTEPKVFNQSGLGPFIHSEEPAAGWVTEAGRRFEVARPQD